MNNQDSYKILSFQASQTKNGKEMWRIGMQKEDADSILTGIIWQEEIPRFDGTKFKVGNVIRFLGQDYSSNYNSVVIKNVTVLKEALTGLPEAIGEMYLGDINAYIAHVIETYGPHEGEPLADVEIAKRISILSLALELKGFINLPAFSTTPAAEKFHHNYIGGLLKHTHEVLNIIDTLGAMFPVEKLTEVKLAAILHDVGKMFEYKTNLELGTATTNKEWMYEEFSHIFWGVTLAKKCEAFGVARMVAAHHGRVEWGALFEPETPEEKLLHLADMLSATIGITTIDKLEVLVEGIAVSEPEEETKEEIADACENDSNIL